MTDSELRELVVAFSECVEALYDFRACFEVAKDMEDEFLRRESEADALRNWRHQRAEAATILNRMAPPMRARGFDTLRLRKFVDWSEPRRNFSGLYAERCEILTMLEDMADSCLERDAHRESTLPMEKLDQPRQRNTRKARWYNLRQILDELEDSGEIDSLSNEEIAKRHNRKYKASDEVDADIVRQVKANRNRPRVS